MSFHVWGLSAMKLVALKCTQWLSLAGLNGAEVAALGSRRVKGSEQAADTREWGSRPFSADRVAGSATAGRRSSTGGQCGTQPSPSAHGHDRSTSWRCDVCGGTDGKRGSGMRTDGQCGTASPAEGLNRHADAPWPFPPAWAYPPFPPPPPPLPPPWLYAFPQPWQAGAGCSQPRFVP